MANEIAGIDLLACSLQVMLKEWGRIWVHFNNPCGICNVPLVQLSNRSWLAGCHFNPETCYLRREWELLGYHIPSTRRGSCWLHLFGRRSYKCQSWLQRRVDPDPFRRSRSPMLTISFPSLIHYSSQNLTIKLWSSEGGPPVKWFYSLDLSLDVLHRPVNIDS